LIGELVALIKSQPDKFTFSSGGFGTPAHMAGELFKLQTALRATHVPYQASAVVAPGSADRLHQIACAARRITAPLHASLSFRYIQAGR
jgi:tripartite-type tricarboxylate transporter receptor subunit TctC